MCLLPVAFRPGRALAQKQRGGDPPLLVNNDVVDAACRSEVTGLRAMYRGAACRTYNVLVQEERRVAAALFLS